MVGRTFSDLFIPDKNFDNEKNFWKDVLSGDFVIGKIPYDFKILNTGEYIQQVVSKELPQSTFGMINSVNNSSEYNVLLSGIIYIIAKYSCYNDIIIGISESKENLDKRNMIMPLRMLVNEDLTFNQYLLELKQNISNINENSNIPYPLLMDMFTYTKYSNENTLFNVVVLSDNVHNKNFVSDIHSDIVFVISSTENLKVELNYDARFFKESTMKTVMDELFKFYKAVFKESTIKLKDVNVLSKREKNHVQKVHDDKFISGSMRNVHTDPKTLQQLFEKQVKKTPQKIAITYMNKEITYERLNKRANMLANTLRNKGIKPDDVIGIMVKDNIEMMIGRYAIIKSGGAYLPISPVYTKEKIEYIAKDIQMKMLITQSCFVGKINLDCEILDMEKFSVYTGTAKDLKNVNSPTDTAYVLYTFDANDLSNKTMIQHHLAVNKVISIQQKYPLTEHDVLLQKTSYIFDRPLLEIFWCISTGASIYMLMPGTEKEYNEIVDIINTHGITTMYFVPSMLNEFLRYVKSEKSSIKKLEGLTRLFTSGGLLEINSINEFKHLFDSINKTRLINLYDPTETVIGLSFFECLDAHKDFSIWQNRFIEKSLLKNYENYWIKVFSGKIPMLDIPTDYKRHDTISFEKDHIQFRLEKNTVDKLYSLADDLCATLYMVLFSAYNILLSKYSEQEDIVVGLPVIGKAHPKVKNSADMFNNVLAIRSYPVGSKSFKEFLEEVKLNSIRAFRNKDYPFENLVEKLNMQRDVSNNPIFSTMFTLQNIESFNIATDDITFKDYFMNNKVSNFEIMLKAVKNDGVIDFEFEYNSKLFKKEKMLKMSIHFKNIIDCVVINPTVKLFEIDMLSKTEKNMLLFEIHNSYNKCLESKPIHKLFEDQVCKMPHSTALILKKHHITYHELNSKANRLARKLKNRGAGKGKIVAVLMDNSIEMIISIFGVLKSDSAYFPLDPNAPFEKIKYMLTDSGADILLLKSDYTYMLDFNCKKIFVDRNEMSLYSSNDLETSIDENSTAYVTYVYDKTDNYKKIVISHKSISDRIILRKENYLLDSKDCTLQIHSFSSGEFLTSFFTHIISGVPTVILDNCQLNNITVLKDNIKKYNITKFITIPKILDKLLDLSNSADYLKSLNVVTLVGSKIIVKLIEKCAKITPYLKIINEYKFIEGAALSVVSNTNDTGKTVVTGKPIANTKIYIVDKYNNLRPFGLTGKLCVSNTDSLKDSEFTDEKFIKVPFLESELIYKTDESVRYLPNGRVEFLDK
jgi:non-ribosomal peptide synthetase component F